MGATVVLRCVERSHRAAGSLLADLVMNDAAEPGLEPAFLAVVSACGIFLDESGQRFRDDLLCVGVGEAHAFGVGQEHRCVTEVESLPRSIVTGIEESVQQGCARSGRHGFIVMFPSSGRFFQGALDDLLVRFAILGDG